MDMNDRTSIRSLTKHEGLGNDFLVLLDREDRTSLDPADVRLLCDRRRGVGADGLLRAVASPDAEVDAVMELYNADGGRAEMSGNGIRCLAQALLLGGWAQKPEVVLATDAGRRTVTVDEGPTRDLAGRTTHVLSVEMGKVRRLGDAPDWAPGVTFRAAWADAGNPHLVLEVGDADSVAGFDLVDVGERVNAASPDGANVHVVGPGPGDDEITVRTYERGVGPTEACGTGACASAVTAASWGLVNGSPGGTITVTMPGGRAKVTLGEEPEAPVVLTGPATAVARVETPWP